MLRLTFRFPGVTFKSSLPGQTLLDSSLFLFACRFASFGPVGIEDHKVVGLVEAGWCAEDTTPLPQVRAEGYALPDGMRLEGASRFLPLNQPCHNTPAPQVSAACGWYCARPKCFRKKPISFGEGRS